MYNKNLTEEFRLRLSEKDMDFLKELSNERAVSVSECVRSIISEYRRSIEMINALNTAIQMTQKESDVHGDTKTDFDN